MGFGHRRDLQPTLFQGGQVGVHRGGVQTHNMNVAAGGGVAVNQHLHRLPHRHGAHIDDVGLVAGHVPRVFGVIVRGVGQHRDILRCPTIHEGKILPLFGDGGGKLRLALRNVEGGFVVHIGAVGHHLQLHLRIQADGGPRQGGVQRLLTRKGRVFHARIILYLRVRHIAKRQCQLVAVDIAGLPLRRNLLHQRQLGVGGDAIGQNHVPQTEQGIHRCHKAMVQVTVHPINRVAQIPHENGGLVGVAGGKGGQSRIVMQCGVYAGGAGQIFQTVEGVPHLLTAQLLCPLHRRGQHRVVAVVQIGLVVGEMLVLVHGDEGVARANQQFGANHRQQHPRHKAGVGFFTGAYQQHRAVHRQKQQVTVQNRRRGTVVAPQHLPQHQIHRTAAQRGKHLLGGDGGKLGKHPRRQQQQHKAHQEGEAVRQVVGRVQAMPQQVPLVDGAAEQQHRQQTAIAQAAANRHRLLG